MLSWVAQCGKRLVFADLLLAGLFQKQWTLAELCSHAHWQLGDDGLRVLQTCRFDPRSHVANVVNLSLIYESYKDHVPQCHGTFLNNRKCLPGTVATVWGLTPQTLESIFKLRQTQAMPQASYYSRPLILNPKRKPKP